MFRCIKKTPLQKAFILHEKIIKAHFDGKPEMVDYYKNMLKKITESKENV